MGSNSIKAGVVGGAGYTGGETLRLLVNHPDVQISFVQSRSQAGKSITDIHRDLVGDTDLKFVDTLGDADVV
ncbi:MAG TPA: N-acetyl-gamma-glutamyl-phosphate reductase, partial [Cyclobacteriaceae bacterium]|nr:N-acetyl-gamma-glutamyl-phosphate reductase [Cyclobacteriaceae bacterium]